MEGRRRGREKYPHETEITQNPRFLLRITLTFRTAGIQEAEGAGCERGHGFEAGDGVVEADFAGFREAHFG